MTSIVLRADHKRYFTNPCEHDPSVLAKFCTDEWLTNIIDQLSSRLTSRQVLKEEVEEGGPYTGVGGIGYSLLKVGQALPEKLKSSVDLCNQLVAMQMVNAKNGSKSRETRYLTGTLGLYVIQAISDHMAGRSIKKFEEKFASFIDTVCMEGYQRIGDDDVLNGRSGFLLAVQMLRLATGSQVLSNSDIRRVLCSILTSGRLYARRNKSPAPLFFSWHQKEYLGAAHGLSGVLQALLTFWDLLRDDEKVDVKETVDWFVSIQAPDGNFPSSSGYVSYPKGEEELVHYCHGSPGVIHMLISAAIVFSDDYYLQSARRCADLIWHRGLLRKGPGICHGVAGNGYAFLLLYRLVNDPVLLQRAKAFAVIMLEPKFEQLAATPDSPFSLFEGWSGALCFLIDVRNPARAQFPLLPINFAN